MKKHTFSGRVSAGLWLYGLHPVRAALANSRRRNHKLILTEHATASIGRPLLGRVPFEVVSAEAVARCVPPGAVHQGAALLCDPLSPPPLKDVLTAASDKTRIAVILDQISDPHNVGAILRSAAAFGATAVVVQDRHAPQESGALAKAASGALDIVPYVTVVNIARVLEEMGELGFWRIALIAGGEKELREAAPHGDVALVLGSEGSGIRRLVRERCDAAVFIPVQTQMESLNVSNAAAIALYELRQERR